MEKTILSLLALLSAQAFAADAVPVVVADSIALSGDVDHQLYLQVKAAIDRGIRKITITSDGGEVTAGVAIGQLIRQNEVSVTVDKYCHSSCANYIFLAGKEKSVLPGAILGFHGGLHKKDSGKVVASLKEKPNPVLAQVLEQYKLQQALYDALGFDDELLGLSFELTKRSAPQPDRYEITAIDGTVFTATTSEEFGKKYTELTEKKQLKSLRIEVASTQSTSKVYFPSRATLEKYGAKGIAQYSYPANAEQMAALAKMSGKLELVGDFN